MINKIVASGWYLSSFSNYDYMFRPYLVAIIRLYILSIKSFVQNIPARLCLVMGFLSS